jgi:hypothetical protein
MTFPDDILSAFSAREMVRKGYWIAHCPLHRDERPSLEFWRSRCGEKLIMGCWSCRAAGGGSNAYKAEILRTAGLKMSDLYADAHSRENGDFKPHVQPKVVAVYPYTDEYGEVLYEKVRWEPKRFSQRRPDGCGGYFHALGSVRRVPYLLPLLLARPTWPVLMLEGEKDCETACGLGLLATCTTEGAGSGWGPDSPYPDFFVGTMMLDGRIASVRIVRLPGLTYRSNGGDDFTDFVRKYRGRAAARAAVIEAITSTREFS